MGSAALSSGKWSRDMRGDGKTWGIKDFENTPFYLVAFSRRVYDQKEAIVDHHELELFIQIRNVNLHTYKILRVSYSKEGLKSHELIQPRATSPKKTITYIIKHPQQQRSDSAKDLLGLMKEYERSEYSLFGSHCQSFCDEALDRLKFRIGEKSSSSVWDFAMEYILREQKKRRVERLYLY